MSDHTDKYYSVAVKTAKHVGAIIKSRIWAFKKRIETKSSAVDFVTDTDQEVEGYIKGVVHKYFPDHAFIGEESALTEQKFSLTYAPTWIIDPIDGTLNFVHGHPNVCVSMAILVKKVTEIAIVYNPITELFFEARRGRGALLNGKPIQVSKTTELSNALLAFEFGYSQDPEKLQNALQNVSQFLGRVQSLRSSGSAAYNLALVAMGACDAYFEFGIHAWDIAAGELIVREAGGVVLDTTGADFNLFGRKILCASTLALAKNVCKEIVQFHITPESIVTP